MNEKHYHEAPIVSKTPVSLVVLEGSDLESTAIRSVLEYFGFRVDTHWIGSRKEFLEVLKGNIPTADLIILSTHGDEQEGMYTLTDEKPLKGDEIGKIAILKGKSVVSLGCYTGTDELAQGFLKTGCETYIAPTASPFGNTSLLLVIHVSYQMRQHKKSLKEAVAIARQYDSESGMFKIFEKNTVS